MAEARLLQARAMVAAFLLGVRLPSACDPGIEDGLASRLLAIARRRGYQL